LLPYVWDGYENIFNPLDETRKIKVGFCGLNNQYRKNLLQALKDDLDIEANFILRDKFWGEAPHHPNLISDFSHNLSNNHLQACDRGRGNFSMRFYQTLSAGRIPLISNVDMPLPFEDLIKWDEAIIRGASVEEALENIKRLKGVGEIFRRQIQCQKIYSEFFEPNQYFKNLFTRYPL